MYNIFKILLLTLCCSCFVQLVAAQTPTNEVKTDSLSAPEKQKTAYEILIDSMSGLMTRAEASENVSEKERLSGIFQNILTDELKKEGSFKLPFDTIPHVAILTSADSLVRMFSWSIPAQQKAYFKYFCILQHRLNKTTKISDIFVLDDTKASIKAPEYEVLKHPNWYGCVYYQLVQKADGKKTYYTLIGHDFNDGITYKKCVDVLTFDKRQNPVFGAPIFMLDRKPQSRVFLEYSAQSVMKLAYFEDMDKIVFNYLYPIIDEVKNDKRYYVPDTSYEGLMFRLGNWIKIPNVEMRAKE